MTKRHLFVADDEESCCQFFSSSVAQESRSDANLDATINIVRTCSTEPDKSESLIDEDDYSFSRFESEDNEEGDNLDTGLGHPLDVVGAILSMRKSILEDDDHFTEMIPQRTSNEDSVDSLLTKMLLQPVVQASGKKSNTNTNIPPMINFENDLLYAAVVSPPVEDYSKLTDDIHSVASQEALLQPSRNNLKHTKDSLLLGIKGQGKRAQPANKLDLNLDSTMTDDIHPVASQEALLQPSRNNLKQTKDSFLLGIKGQGKRAQNANKLGFNLVLSGEEKKTIDVDELLWQEWGSQLPSKMLQSLEDISNTAVLSQFLAPQEKNKIIDTTEEHLTINLLSKHENALQPVENLSKLISVSQDAIQDKSLNLLNKKERSSATSIRLGPIMDSIAPDGGMLLCSKLSQPVERNLEEKKKLHSSTNQKQLIYALDSFSQSDPEEFSNPILDFNPLAHEVAKIMNTTNVKEHPSVDSLRINRNAKRVSTLLQTIKEPVPAMISISRQEKSSNMLDSKNHMGISHSSFPAEDILHSNPVIHQKEKDFMKLTHNVWQTKNKHSIPIAYPTFDTLPKEKRFIANTERYQTMGSFSPGEDVLNARVLSQPGKRFLKPVAVSIQLNPKNIQREIKTTTCNEWEMQLHEKISHEDVKIITPNVISVDALNLKHLSKELLQCNDIIPPSKSFSKQNTIKPKQKMTTIANSHLVIPHTQVNYKTNVQGPVKKLDLQDYGSMVPTILSQQVKNNMDLLGKQKSLVNRNTSPQRKNKASKPNVGSNLLASINIKTVSTMDCDIQPSTNLSMKDKDVKVCDKFLQSITEVLLYDKCSQSTEKILNHDTDVNLTASQVIPVDALNIKHQNKKSLQSKNIIPPAKQLLQQNAIKSKLTVTADSDLQKGKRQFFANESIVPTGTGWSDSFQPFPSKPFLAAQSLPYIKKPLPGNLPINTVSSPSNNMLNASSKPFLAAQSLPYMENFLLGICPINTTSHQPIHVLKNERESLNVNKELREKSMTKKRISWEDRMAKLREFKITYGHCNVPRKYAEDPSLALWARNQRVSQCFHNRIIINVP